MKVPRAAILLIFFFALSLMAEDNPGDAPASSAKKPACGSSTRGLYWPEDANRDSRALQKYARDGVLERCVSGPWRHRWQTMTVSAKTAASKPGARISSAKK